MSANPLLKFFSRLVSRPKSPAFAGDTATGTRGARSALSAQQELFLTLCAEAVGESASAYYERVFRRFVRMGGAKPTWNHAAAFSTLGWCALRGLWRQAGIYAAVVLVLLLVWSMMLRGQVALGVEIALVLFGVSLSCVVPGLLGNTWYYKHLQNQILVALEQSGSATEARVQLRRQGASKKRVRIAALGHLGCLLIVASLFGFEAEKTDSTEQADEQANQTQSEEVEKPPEPVLKFPLSVSTTPPVAPPTNSATSEPSAPSSVAIEPPPPPSPTVADSLRVGRFYVNLGSYTASNIADATQKRVLDVGYPIVRDSGRNRRGAWVRLRVGPFNSQEQAQEAQEKLRGMNLRGSVFQHRP